MAEEKAKTFISKSGDLEGKAYANNFRAHRPGISMTEMSNCYSKWGSMYEEDLNPKLYRGPAMTADCVSKLYSNGKENVKILDIAAGTGFVGVELWQKGFRHIDGLDPAKGLLDLAEQKGVYSKLYCNFITREKLDIKEDTYDVITISGGFGEGHIPCGALYEMIRLVKPGGFVVIAMREEYLQYVEEYRDRLEPLMQELEDSGKWKRISRDVLPKYSFDNNGIIFQYKIC